MKCQRMNEQRGEKACKQYEMKVNAQKDDNRVKCQRTNEQRGKAQKLGQQPEDEMSENERTERRESRQEKQNGRERTERR